VTKTSALDRARSLLDRVPLADGHNDLPWALRLLAGSDVLRAWTRIDLAEEQSGLHTDLPRLARGRVGVQFWSVYVPCRRTSSRGERGRPRSVGHQAVTTVLEQIELVYALADRYPDRLAVAHTAAAAEKAFTAGRVASLLGAEGGHCIAESLGVLRALYRLGVRYLTLTHNENVPWADSATDVPAVGGLTDFGREVVREMNRLGMLVDLSHVAPSTMHHALDSSTAPVIFSHSSCRAVADHPRNVPDDVLGRLPGNGGVIMITFVPRFVSPAYAAWDDALRAAMTAAGEDHRDLATRARFAETWTGGGPRPRVTLDDVVVHLEHAREVVGIDHLGLGGDYDGVDVQPEGLADVSCYPALFAALLDRGWSEADCAKLAGGNTLRVLRDAESVACG
jgi:membrane dipeptidase